tara:strand:+ start:929 stop:2929 length:2001 start_codon:yes stop_codon:yes gene_type:complete
MEENRLRTIVEAEIHSAIGYIESETTDARRKSLNAYLRKPYGTEIEGRSSIVTGEVAEVIDGALPNLMRIFTATDNVVKFEAKNAKGEESAKQATQYCNWVFTTQNQGFNVLHETFKTALLQKVGIFKVYYEEKTNSIKEEYKGLTEQELVLLLQDDTREILEQNTDETFVEELAPDGQPLPPLVRHDVIVRKKTNIGEIKIEALPPEEFLISKSAKTIQDSNFVAHRKLVTRSDLVSMGYDPDLVASLPANNELSYTPERIGRFSEGERPDEIESLDKAMQEVEIYECYIYTDFDDDQEAELRLVVYAANKILYNEETDYVPFHSICPYPLPHKFFGQSLADRVIDIQEQKTAITRSVLDSLYLSLAPRIGAVEGQVNLDDLLNLSAGGVVRMKNPNAVVPMTVPLVAQQAFPILEYLDQVQGKRSGVSEAMQGLNPDVLQNVTAAAIAASTSAATGKIELIARIFAETGIKSMFRGILQLAAKYQDKARTIQLNGKYIEVDPRQWDNQYDITINVGLGTGDTRQQMSLLQMVMAKQEEIIKGYGPSNPLVSIGQYRNTLEKFIELAGYKDVKQFFRDIPPEMDQALSQPQQKQPDPLISAAMQQAQAQLQLDRQKAEADIALKREKMMADLQLKRDEMMAELELKKQELLAETQLDQQKAMMGQ